MARNVDPSVVRSMVIAQQENAANHLKFLAEYVPIWERKALELKAAADIIYADLIDADNKIKKCLEDNTDSSSFHYATAGLNQVWMLTAGYSVEVLVKAIIIATTSEEITTLEGEFKKSLWGNRPHDSYFLLEKKLQVQYKPSLSEEETSLIRKMSSYTTWRGKYPVPINSDAFFRYGMPGKEDMAVDLGPARLTDDRDKKCFDNIFDSLYTKLQEVKGIKG